MAYGSLPGPEIKSIFPVLAGGFLATGPPGKFLKILMCFEDKMQDATQRLEMNKQVSNLLKTIKNGRSVQSYLWHFKSTCEMHCLDNHP